MIFAHVFVGFFILIKFRSQLFCIRFANDPFNELSEIKERIASYTNEEAMYKWNTSCTDGSIDG